MLTTRKKQVILTSKLNLFPDVTTHATVSRRSRFTQPFVFWMQFTLHMFFARRMLLILHAAIFRLIFRRLNFSFGSKSWKMPAPPTSRVSSSRLTGFCPWNQPTKFSCSRTKPNCLRFPVFDSLPENRRAPNHHPAGNYKPGAEVTIRDSVEPIFHELPLFFSRRPRSREPADKI